MRIQQEIELMVHYVAIIDGLETGKMWGVRFPDVPGCVAQAETPEEAISQATAALRNAMAYSRDGGIEFPKPSGIAEILASGEVRPREAIALIPLIIELGRTVRVNLTFDAALLAAIDKASKDRGLTRSAFLASAAREKIEASR
jgi:predicted RNase H-like HicB family nuclease